MSSVNGINVGIDDTTRKNAFRSAKLLHKFPVTVPKNYVLKSSTENAMHKKFAVALSNNLVQIYDNEGSLCQEYEHPSNISYIKYSRAEPDILFTSSLEGKIHVWDTRSQHCVQTFYDDSDGALKPILCFDYTHDEQVICAGTELIREDAFHLFWDRRLSKILGGYWNSHAADITQIHFYPYNTNLMASSSVDGLINIFDLNEASEDDALTETFNIEAPVYTFTWKSENILSCTTGIEEAHLIEMETAQSILSTSREKFHKDFQISVDCMIDSLHIKKKFYIAAGKNTGPVYLWNTNKNSGYILEGHTDTVRTISYNDETGMLLTGGDDGCICLWKLKSPKVLDEDNTSITLTNHEWYKRDPNE